MFVWVRSAAFQNQVILEAEHSSTEALINQSVEKVLRAGFLDV